MHWHINELSLDGQYADTNSFVGAFKPVVKAISISSELRRRLKISYRTITRPVCQQDSFRDVIDRHHDKDFKFSILSWLTKTGSFWDDTRTQHPDDYFEIYQFDVTDQGLGEAARAVISGEQAGSFSFIGSALRFDIAPLVVQHGLRESPLGQISVENIWTIEELERRVQALESLPEDWSSAGALFRRRYPHLVLSSEIEGQLEPHPFSLGLTGRISKLLSILNSIAAETGLDGRLSKPGQELYDLHFVGGQPLFTAESEQNKIDFERRLTFKDPADTQQQLFCDWHGKINTPKYRVHFEWPRPAGQKEIKVVYIGPKLTKH